MQNERIQYDHKKEKSHIFKIGNAFFDQKVFYLFSLYSLNYFSIHILFNRENLFDIFHLFILNQSKFN